MCTNVNFFSLQELLKTQTGLFNEPTSPFALANLSGLWDYLNSLRQVLGQPIVVNSAFRTEQVNKQVGGAKRSLHMQGRAADIRTSPLYMDELWKLLQADRDNLSELIHKGTYIHFAL